jgi:hypothetical protein
MAKSGVHLQGVERVTANLNKALKQYTVLSMGGLLRAVAYIRHDMEKTRPLTPVDTGQMRAGWESIANYNNVSVTFGYPGVNYAPFVHQYNNATTNWSRPGSGGQWFEKAIARNTDQVLRIMGENLRTG